MPPTRLINTRTYELHKNVLSPEYAILSHKWVEPEVTFQQLDSTEWRTINLESQPMKKIRDACKKARERSSLIEWLWVDTCCIDKTDNVELASALNSMFEWYFGATVCYGYLYDVKWIASSRQISKSTDPKRPGTESAWFERGWTLQELLAPRYMEFYDRDWNFMDTRKNLADLIHERTGIAEKYLTGASNFKVASVATKLSWMAGRTTSAVEDIAYSMLGLLNITMEIRYGEGVKAFMRLQRTLMESSTDESLFAWTTPAGGLACYRGLGHVPEFSPTHWGLLAPSPDCFSKYTDLVVLPDRYVPRLAGGYRMTQQGVHFVMPWTPTSEVISIFGWTRRHVTLGLNCCRFGDNGKPYNVGIKLLWDRGAYRRVKLDDLKKASKPKSNKLMGLEEPGTKTLTISQPEFDPFT